MAGPHPAVAATRSAVAASVTDLPDGARVLVACSGGPDSLALAAATAFVAAGGGRARLRAGAVVVDHGLQPGSAEVASRAAAACRRLGLDPVEVVAVDVTGPGGPEAAARAARADALHEVAGRLGAAAVLLGHTRDDQAEGVLLGLARGSGARSLAGMAPVRGLLRRPLLAVTREQTVAACAALGLDPWHDPTNAGAAPDDPRRSRVRAHVMPVLERELGPGVAAALARSAELLREDADALDALAAQLLDRARAVAGAGDAPGPALPEPAVALDAAVLAAAPAALRARALRAAAVLAGSPAGALAAAHVRAVDALVTAWHGQGPVHLPGRVEASRACGRLALRAAPPAEPADDDGGARGTDGAGEPAEATQRGDRHR
ncbi:tRNA lysidine(34) synthetase TilS [Cellulomonas sp. C5510]|uniref:tRNA lysidine(34) synthetase TilS n=1 Tax=Cellulomonas sp. C5510 TaxID=2871170 RepID=UPI001C95631B|nr:tRNA lysidine(34) synthetase TilS [Cellulomonas sp. C5510]QZN86054.1 tRNA lysidine(34) synthetase TilS [Cellulomonas sp. C5510]